MRDQVEEVKLKTDIVAVIGEHVKLTKAGKHWKGLCPFHSEKTPSFIVSPELQIYKCFGCAESGDVFTFLEKFEGMEFSEALHFLAERAGVKLAIRGDFAKNDKDVLYQINQLSAKFYHYLLLNHAVGKHALDYLMGARGLLRETIETFQIGVAPQNQTALVSYLINKKKFKQQDLDKAGVAVIVKGRLIDRFRGRVIFPLLDHRGNTVGLAGRIMPGPLADRLAKYINSPQTPIYNKSAVLYGLNITRPFIKSVGFAIVVEGELDMISTFQAGIKNVVALKGSALTEEQARMLSRLTNNLVLALDSDLAGDSAAKRGISIAQKLGMNIKVVTLGSYKDPDDFARADPKGFKEAIKNAVNIWDFLINSIFSKHNHKTGEGKAAISREIVPVLASIDDKIVQAHYAAVVGRKLSVATETVLSQVEGKSTTTNEKIDDNVEAGKPKEATRRELLEEDILSLGFNSGPEILLQSKVVELFEGHTSTRLLKELEQYLLDHEEFEIKDFAGKLPEELKRRFAELILINIEEKPAQKLLHDLAQAYYELLLLVTKLKQEELTRKMQEQENAHDKAGLKSIKREYLEVNRKLSEYKSASFNPSHELGIA